MTKYVLLIISLWVGNIALAQEYEYSEKDIYRSPIRKILNQLSINISTGYNSTTYKHDLSGYYYLQSPTQQLIVRNEGPLGQNLVAYDNWFNNPSIGIVDSSMLSTDVPFPAIDRPVLSNELNTGFTVFDADSVGLEFKGKGRDIPINIGIRYNFKGFRIGGGVSLAFHKVSAMKPVVDGHGIRSYQPLNKTTLFTKYYAQLGYKFYDWWDYSFAGEIEFGKNKLGKRFNQGAVSNGIYFNLGISIEKNLSEYFRIFVKPSYDFRSFNSGLPAGGGSIKHKQNAFNVGLGVSITIPEIPRSPIKSDHVQLKHVIVHPKTGRYTEVRGQPIWKKQNPKVGQNHRKMIKHKLGNKKKLSPY